MSSYFVSATHTARRFYLQPIRIFQAVVYNSTLRSHPSQKLSIPQLRSDSHSSHPLFRQDWTRMKDTCILLSTCILHDEKGASTSYRHQSENCKQLYTPQHLSERSSIPLNSSPRNPIPLNSSQGMALPSLLKPSYWTIAPLAGGV
ncbi:hypothetical protein TNCV_431911 [Trichonephila clavipes]|nr:hypothetical protein TNCV_431911 [Trichonephila clavipes]